MNLFYHPLLIHQISNRWWHITPSQPNVSHTSFYNYQHLTRPTPYTKSLIQSISTLLLTFIILQSYVELYRPITGWNKSSPDKVVCIGFVRLFVPHCVWGATTPPSKSGIDNKSKSLYASWSSAKSVGFLSPLQGTGGGWLSLPACDVRRTYTLPLLFDPRDVEPRPPDQRDPDSPGQLHRRAIACYKTSKKRSWVLYR